MLASLSEVMPLLGRRSLCLPGFDIGGGQPDFLLGALGACERARCPALLLIWAPGTTYMSLDACVELVRFHADRASVPVILHLDHGKDTQTVERCLELGFKSVMFDGSDLPLDDNIRLTKEMVRAAHAAGATIEGELGRFGEELGEGKGKAALADLDEAERFCRETRVDLLAPAVGNAHGQYRSKPNLRFDLIDQIARRTNVPLSLHGGTGIPLADIRKAAGLGVRKLNIASQLHRDFSDALKDAASAERFYWRRALDAGRAAIGATVERYIRELGVEGIA